MSKWLASVWCILIVALPGAVTATVPDQEQKPPQKKDGEKPDRSPRQVAEQLAVVYGKKLDQVAYIPALPLVAKLRLSELTRDPKYAQEVDRIVAPYLRGDKSPVPKNGSE